MKIKSSFVYWFCVLFILIVGFFYYPRWNQKQGECTISFDVSGYYMYLPATFIYHDLKHCGFKDSILKDRYQAQRFDEAFVHPSGNYVMKYSMGQALMMSPFFLTAHFITQKFTHYPPDGFSYPYQVGIGVGLLLFGIIGLFFLRKVLLEFFPDWIVSLSLITLVLGTNYLNYAAIDTGMTHSGLFAIYSILMYQCILFYKRQNFRTALAIGLLIGLATLIRPTEIIALILPVLWNVTSLETFKERIRFLIKNIRFVIVTGIAILSIACMQMLYWKWAAGEWIVYSYQDQGFSWLHPHIYDFSLEYRCGWLRLCPMMIFAFLGIVPLIKLKKNTFAILFFFAINFYIVTAWDIWDYGGTGGRAMVQSYPILIFCIASLILYVHQYKLLKLIFYPLFLFCLYINIWWTHNAHRGSVQVMDMSNKYYWAVLGKWKIDDEVKKYLDNKDVYFGTPKNEHLLYQNDFQNDTSSNVYQDESGNKMIYVDKDHQTSTEYSFPFETTSQYHWLRASADYSCGFKEWDIWKMAQVKIRFLNKGVQVKDNWIRLYRFMYDGCHSNIYIDAKIPSEKFDSVSVVLWNAGGDKKMTMDNLKVVAF